MKSIVLLTLSLFLGTFFIFVGTLKVTQLLHREMHREIRRNFIQYVKVFPLDDKLLQFKITPKLYRLAIGYLEIICGCLLVILPNQFKLKNIANIILIFSNLLSLYTHYKLKDSFEKIAPSIVFSLMLTCRLIVYLQVKRRIENQDKLKEREERRRLIESGEFDLDRLTCLTEDDIDESIEDIDDDELEKLIKISKKIHKNQKRKELSTDVEEVSFAQQKTIELSCTQESKLLDDLNEEDKEQLIEESKKSI